MRALLALFLLLSACSERAAERPAASVEETAWEKIRAGAVLVDVRTPAEYARGHLEGALNIPYDQIEVLAETAGVDPEREIVLYCRSGGRARIARQTLEELGFQRVFNAGSYQRLLQAAP